MNEVKKLGSGKFETLIKLVMSKMDQISELLDNPATWEKAEEELLLLIKDPDESTRLSADLLLKNLQRKKFNKFLNKFESPISDPSKEVTMQRTVTRTLSMIIPRGLKKEYQQSDTESEADQEAEKKPSPVIDIPKIDRKQLPAIPPKPQRQLPQIPKDANIPPPLPPKDFKKSFDMLRVDIEPVNFDALDKDTPNVYYPSLEELEQQNRTKQSAYYPSLEELENNFRASSPLPPMPIQNKQQPLPININQQQKHFVQQPAHQHQPQYRQQQQQQQQQQTPSFQPMPGMPRPQQQMPNSQNQGLPASLYPNLQPISRQPSPQQTLNQEYKFKMLQNYLSTQRQIAQDQYLMDSPQVVTKTGDTDSPSINVMSSISNQPPVDLYGRIQGMEPPVPEIPNSSLHRTVLPRKPDSLQRQQLNPISNPEMAEQPRPISNPPEQQIAPHRGLNTVYVPKLLVGEFMKIATLNTSMGIETCGLLAGKLRKIKRSSIKQQSAYLITHLIVPQQTGTPNSCVMEGEELVANFQIDNDLLTVISTLI